MLALVTKANAVAFVQPSSQAISPFGPIFAFKRSDATYSLIYLQPENLSMDLLAYTLQTSHGVIGTIILVLDIIAIFSLLMGRGTIGHKLLWILLILFLPFVGMVLYYLLGRNASDA